MEFAQASGRRAATIPVVTFLKLTGGQSFEVQVSQSFQNGNVDARWARGAAITAKAEGLWEPQSNVSAEDVRHMQSRVEQFVATEQLPRDILKDVPMCKESWAWWVVTRSAAFAARAAPRALPFVEPAADEAEDSARGQIEGFDALMAKTIVPHGSAAALMRDLHALGAISVRELSLEDWFGLPSWGDLRPLEQRRMTAQDDGAHPRSVNRGGRRGWPRACCNDRVRLTEGQQRSR